MGKISSLPISISKVKTIFEKAENDEKFPAGPTWARPGPTFPRVVRTEVKFVIKSLSSILTRRIETAKIIIYEAINTFTALTVSCSIGLPFIFNLTVDFG